jgi:hypothetical protein
MNGSQKFLTAFLAGLAGPASLYAPTVVYRPFINDLTFSAPFALVGYYLSQAFADHEQLGTVTSAESEQLSLDLGPAATGSGSE